MGAGGPANPDRDSAPRCDADFLRRERLSGDGPDRGRDVVDDAADERFVLAFGHHADDRLGAGLADEDAAGLPERRLAGADGGLHLAVVERLAAVEADADQALRERLE